MTKTILAIETSCDETAICIAQVSGNKKLTTLNILGNALYSQISVHAPYGGVFPSLAKREHSKNLVPLLKQALADAWPEKYRVVNSEDKRSHGGLGVRSFGEGGQASYPPLANRLRRASKLQTLLMREPELYNQLFEFLPYAPKPPINIIAVTYGPGLEPALWVGINFAKALSGAWGIPILPINHMEGHIVSALLRRNAISNFQFPIPKKNLRPTSYKLQAVKFPALALLISGGHTELVLIKDWFKYKIIGETRDDAVGEAFDKVARILGLPYPGGPEISKIAELWRQKLQAQHSTNLRHGNFIKTAPRKVVTPNGNLHDWLSAGQASYKLQTVNLPRPMLRSPGFDFSFSGLKTSVLYFVKKLPNLTEEIRMQVAEDFENAVSEVLLYKTVTALQKFHAKTLIIGGGVSANKHIRQVFEKTLKEKFPFVAFHVSETELFTDNAIMVAAAAALRIKYDKKIKTRRRITATGNLKLG